MNTPRFLLTLLTIVCLPLITAGCGVPIALSVASYAADGASLAGTGKTGTDHFASMVSKKDCALWRMIRSLPMCKDREEGAPDPYDVDYTVAERSMSEDGVQYLAPPRAAADAPVTSWDVAVYKQTPTAPQKPTEPVTAVAEAAPQAPEVLAESTTLAPSHPKKVARSANKAKVKKLSPGRAAPRS